MATIRFLIALLVAGFGVVSELAQSAAQADERIVVKIGFVFPLTGPMASFGADMASALPLLEKKFNHEQSKYRFKFLLEDGKFGLTNAAITAAKKLVAVDGVRFLVVGSSGEILQMAPYLESSRVLAVAGFASHPDVKNAGDYIFRTYIDAGRGIDLVVADILAAGRVPIAVISEESSFTLAIKQRLQQRLGDQIVFSEDFSFGGSDFNTLIAKARSRKPKAYYVNVSTPANFIALVQQLRANGVAEPFYTYYTPSLRDVQEGLGTNLDGTIFLDYPDGFEISADFRELLAEFERTSGSKVRAPFNFKTNYNAVRVVIDGISAVGPDPEKVKQFLYAYDRPSAAGRLQFDENGDAKGLNLILRTYRHSSDAAPKPISGKN